MKRHISITMVLLAHLMAGCEGFLDERPNKDIVVPNTLEDLQALLDGSSRMNNNDPILSFVGADDFYTTDQGWAGFRTPVIASAYRWQHDIFEGEISNDWWTAYQQILYANIVLEQLSAIEWDPERNTEAKQIKGRALFFRARAFYNLLTLFALPYDESIADIRPGIPLKLSANINQREKRASLRKSYQQVFKDLNAAEVLLPDLADYPTRPAKVSVYALLARICLSTSDYKKAGLYADKALSLQSELVDYNSLNSSDAYPFPQFNEEVIFHANLATYTDLIWNSLIIVNDEIYDSYDDQDLRKSLFFKTGGAGVINFKGNYTGSLYIFSGLCTDELYLIRAECAARDDRVEDALLDLNHLLEKRYKTGEFVGYSTTDPDEALNIILQERRKELLFRGTRWSDLRRLNKEPEYATTIIRTINGEIYTLAPDDPRYVYPIPPDEIELNGLEQNVR